MPIDKKILIVDDEKDILNLTTQYLKLKNYNTITCDNGEDALKIIEQQHDDIALVLLDLMLPRISGWEVLERVKKNERYKNILVVLFTVKNFREDIMRGKDLGADGYLTKPFSGKEFLSYLNNLLT